MFENKKMLKEIETAKQQLENEKAEVLRERAELQFIKDQLEDTSPKVDITGVNIVEKQGIKYLANAFCDRCTGKNGLGINVKGYDSTLVDIFSNQVIHKKTSIYPLQRKEEVFIDTGSYKESYVITCTPICEVVPELLAYPDKQVPEYVLKQAYYKLNNVNVNSKILRKEK